MLVDSWYDPYLGVVILVRVIDGAHQARASRSSSWPPAPTHLVDRVGCFRPKIEQLTELGPGEIGFITAQIKEVAETRVGDTITDAKRPAAAGAARLQGGPAGGVLRPVPGRRRRLREAARQPLQAAPQRRHLQLRDGDQRRARLRLPLRLPRPAPPRDHPGAADPRIRPRPHHHRALGGLPDPPAPLEDRGRAGDRAAQPGRHARPQPHRADRGAVDRGDDLRPRRISRLDPQAVPGPPRHPEEPDLRRRRAPARS